ALDEVQNQSPEGSLKTWSSSPPAGSDEAPQTSSSSICPDQKALILPSRKEPPTYPPGSVEERWQLQIVARGRVTCPKCRSVSRKTVEGLKKHMENCRLQPFTCQHCGKQLKSSTGMKYHIMADHSHLPSLDDVSELDDRAIKDKLRKVLKRLGKLKCSREGCGAAFSSIMGYVYHMKKCGKEEAELEKMLLSCSHCGKNYKSKAGLEYHLKSEHAPVSPPSPRQPPTASGRVQRASAQVANFHLAEIANNDLPKDWPKRKFQSDLVPDDKKLKYARPGLPAFSQEVLRKWKNEVKLQRKVQCPNQGCGCTYTSVSGLKAHLGLCTRGDFEAGKYRCLICNKEFNSESGVKYHINSVHSQEWFVTNKKASKKFEKFLKNQPKEFVHSVDKQSVPHLHHHHLHHHLQHQQHYQHHHHQHHHHHHHPPPPQQLQPLQPLHHLQHQPQFLHPDRACLPHQGEPPLLYTPLEPPAAAVWVEMEQREDEPGPEQAPIEMELAVIDKEEVEAMEEEEERGSRQPVRVEPEGTL
uniref:Zinc finger protein 512 n=1 Tax=Salarias fasciatus TaxID=181472 RepID=A0A672I7V7_SALFA